MFGVFGVFGVFGGCGLSGRGVLRGRACSGLFGVCRWVEVGICRSLVLLWRSDGITAWGDGKGAGMGGRAREVASEAARADSRSGAGMTRGEARE